MGYFNEMKQSVSVQKSQINQTEEAINRLFYEIFGLTNDEINMIEQTTPE